MAMSLLPNEMLMVVFAQLDCRVLLAARGVCRRWRALIAARPEAWTRFELNSWDPWLRPVLLVAPSLRKLTMRLFRCPPNYVILWDPLLSTDCGIRELVLRIEKSIDEKDFVQAMEMLQRQTAIGQLRVLTLDCDKRQQLLSLMNSLNGAKLDELRLGRSELDSSLRYADVHLYRWKPISLKRLFINKKYIDDDQLQCVLSVEAATLESVQFVHYPSEEEIALLSQCPRLRELGVVPLGLLGLQQLSPALTRLRLTGLWYEDRCFQEALKAAAALLAGAVSLEELELTHFRAASGPRVVLRLMAALTSSCAATLHTLRLTDFTSGRPQDEVLRQLLAALRAMPRLHTLTLPWKLTANVLQALAVPSLRLLDLRASACNGYGPCVVPGLRALLTRNPRLHCVTLPRTYPTRTHKCFQESSELACCCLARHPRKPAAQFQFASAYFGHATSDPCSIPGCRGDEWVQLVPSRAFL